MSVVYGLVCVVYYVAVQRCINQSIKTNLCSAICREGIRGALWILPVRPSVWLSREKQKGTEKPRLAWTFLRTGVIKRCAGFQLESRRTSPPSRLNHFLAWSWSVWRETGTRWRSDWSRLIPCKTQLLKTVAEWCQRYWFIRKKCLNICRTKNCCSRFYFKLPSEILPVRFERFVCKLHQ